MSDLGGHSKLFNAGSSVCFSRLAPSDGVLTIDTSPLAHDVALALSETLPFLRCGEESAIHAFSRRLIGQKADAGQMELDSIAEDETRHAAWLESLAAALPAPQQASEPEQMAGFFRRLLTRHRPLHFAQIASLDLAVCALLRPLTVSQSAIHCAPQVHAGLCSIRSDEARHVRVARNIARNLGWTKSQQHKLDLSIREQLAALLVPIESSLLRLGIDVLRIN